MLVNQVLWVMRYVVGSSTSCCARLRWAWCWRHIHPGVLLPPPCNCCVSSYWPDNYTHDTRHPVWQPEGHIHKLGDYPCYDPKKAGRRR